MFVLLPIAVGFAVAIFKLVVFFSVGCADFLKPGFSMFLNGAVSRHLLAHEGTVFLVRTVPLPRSSPNRSSAVVITKPTPKSSMNFHDRFASLDALKP